MKDGSGDLDFGGDDPESEADDESETAEAGVGIEASAVEGDTETAAAPNSPDGDGAGGASETGDTSVEPGGDGVGAEEDRAESEADASHDSEATGSSADAGSSSDAPRGGTETGSHATGGTPSDGAESRYPYLVRRSNVGDERSKRLEVHVRQHVADREAAFRSELADLLDTDEVSKTDAREFALVAAMEHPELVAEQMRAEGFDELV